MLLEECKIVVEDCLNMQRNGMVAFLYNARCGMETLERPVFRPPHVGQLHSTTTNLCSARITVLVQWYRQHRHLSQFAFT